MSPSPGLSRRGLLRGAATLGGAAALAPALAACGGAGGTDADGATRIQLGWLPNVESMALLVAAANGHYRREGVTPKLAPGGPNVVIEPQIITGKVLVGVEASDKLGDAVAKGAPLVAIGATFQRSSSCILSLADKPVRTPKDLEGRRFGVAQSDARVYAAFFRLAGVDASKVTMVPTGTDPSALASGEVDAISATLANQPVALGLRGIRTTSIALADHGYNRWSGLLTVSAHNLRNDATRARIAKVLRGTIRGLQDAVDDPGAAARVVVDRYGRRTGLDPRSQAAGAKVWAGLARTPDTERHGLMRLTPEGIATQERFLRGIGVKADVKAMFDPSLIDEVYGGATRL
ncbi:MULTISPECIES: ABC transporter substrate-binding protein [Actinomadura]|uniref:Thiamine pyrimidine synthase n=1 Tax=Actinomadura yumaensis TaxID=111807 RepID=A0ABW2CTK0_9ACTN|nr:ABC transporter substrate-binding protein [Actinomadura sp. J1-007]MWK38616.1 hypothetical protein [Actinomadura sp. J1-007]